MKNRHILFLLVMLAYALTGCGVDVFEECIYTVGDLIDFTASEDRSLAKYLSAYNDCDEKISIELVSFESFKANQTVQIRIVEVKSKYSYVGIIND